VKLLDWELRATSPLPGFRHSVSTRLRKINSADEKTHFLQHMQVISQSRQAKERTEQLSRQRHQRVERTQ